MKELQDDVESEDSRDEQREIDVVKGIFENEFINNDKMCDMMKKYQESDSIKYIIGKFVEENTRELVPLLDATLFSDRSVFEESKLLNIYFYLLLFHE